MLGVILSRPINRQIKTNQMKQLLLIFILMISVQIFAQDYKDKQVLKFSDSSKTFVIIDEFPVYNTKLKSYEPIKVRFDDFYDYHKTPLGIRYYNFGCVKTKQKGFWMGQIAKDKFGHAIFKAPIYGIRAMALLNIEIIEQRKKNTLLKFFNVYAPSDDCVGSIRDDKGNCIYGYNHPEVYAKKVGDALGIKIDVPINIRNDKGEINTKLMALLLNAVGKFETSKDCKIEESTIARALDLKE